MTRSQFNFFLFLLQHNFASVQLSHYLFLLPHCHQNTPLNSVTKLADNAKYWRRASYMYRVTQENYMTKHNAQYKNKYINSHSSRPSTRQLLVFDIVNLQITVVKMITSKTNLPTLKLDTHFSVKTLIHFTRTPLIFRFVIASMGSMSLWCHWMSW